MSQAIQPTMKQSTPPGVTIGQISATQVPDSSAQGCRNLVSSTETQKPLQQHSETTATNLVSGVTDLHVQPSNALPLPCVLPQTSKSFRGAFFSPFVRAYIPELEQFGISQSDFLTFIDGLNEVFIAHPVFQGLGIAGGIMAMAYGVHPVQWAGMGLQFTSGAASAATSYTRTKKYLLAINKGLFRPAGLNVNIMTTKKMLAKVDYPEERMYLPPLDTFNGTYDSPGDEGSGETQTSLSDHDPRMRRIKALQGYVMPIKLDVPGAIRPDSLLSKMSAAQVRRQDTSQQKKLYKARDESHKKYIAKMEDADEEIEKGNKMVARLEKELLEEHAKYQTKMAKASGNAQKSTAELRRFESKEKKLLHEIEKERRKRDKEAEKFAREAHAEHGKSESKEERIANKIRWIVISNWQGEDTEQETMEDDVEGSPESA